MKKRGRPPKDADRLHSDNILVRVESTEKEAFQIAADLAGVSLSAWMRERLRQVATKELKGAAMSNPLLRN